MPEITISGPEGRLEGRYHHCKQRNAPLALLLHPHPLHGGTMNNKVVYNLYQLFQRRHFSVLRFNFRGVGRSQGAFSRGEGELSDAAAALDWLQTVNLEARAVWVAGFSFGAWIGMQLLMRRPEISRFIAVAPPANMYDFTFLAPCPSSGLIVHGDADEIVPRGDVIKLAEKLASQRAIEVEYRNVRGANHLFYDHLEELIAVIDTYVGETLTHEAAAQ